MAKKAKNIIDPRNPMSSGSGLMLDDYEFPDSIRKPYVDPNFTNRRFRVFDEDAQPTLPFPSEEEKADQRRGRLGEVMNTKMDDEIFRRAVLIHANGLTEDQLLNPGVERNVKWQVYASAGRMYFENESGGLVHRTGAPMPLMCGAFAEDYRRVFPKGRQGKRYNQ